MILLFETDTKSIPQLEKQLPYHKATIVKILKTSNLWQ